MKGWSTPAHTVIRMLLQPSKLPPQRPYLLSLQFCRRSRFATFPDVLVIHAKKFQLVNWVPTKLDVPINLPPSDILGLDNHIGKGLQATEIELPEDKPGKDNTCLVPGSVLNLRFNPEESSGLPVFNAEAMAQLEGMGFPTVRCQKALLATGNADPNAAMEWLFAHMEDPGMIPEPAIPLNR